jgi:hypothetical protein
MSMKWPWVRRRDAVLAIARVQCGHVPGAPLAEGLVCAPCFEQAARWLERSERVGR